MFKNKVIRSFSALGTYMQNPGKFKNIIARSNLSNGWFTNNFVLEAIKNWSKLLEVNNLTSWLEEYDLKESSKNKCVGLLLAGNIPMVGLHDILCTLATGNKACIKLSSADNILIPHFLEILSQIEPYFKNRIAYVEKLTNIDILIATGRNQTVSSFLEYFCTIPKLLRRHRTSVAVLQGLENIDKLRRLCYDIFTYYGLGCRNITEIYVPKEYFKNSADKLFLAMTEYKNTCQNNSKYMNNYNYNKSLCLINNIPFIDAEFLTLSSTVEMKGRIAHLSFTEYNNIDECINFLFNRERDLQFISTELNLGEGFSNVIELGNCQKAKLISYADNVDTIKFLQTY